MFSNIQELEHDLSRGRVTASSIIKLAQLNGLPFCRHPLGFIVCNLLSKDSLKVRLHLWPTSISNSQEALQIHDHTFNFKSWVLYGSIKNIEYIQSELGTEYALYSTSYEDNKSIIKKTLEKITLAESRTSIYDAGSSYEVNAGELHSSSRASKTVAATVLITEDVSRSTPLVAGPLNALDMYEYVRDKLSIEELSIITSEFS